MFGAKTVWIFKATWREGGAECSAYFTTKARAVQYGRDRGGELKGFAVEARLLHGAFNTAGKIEFN